MQLEYYLCLIDLKLAKRQVSVLDAQQTSSRLWVDMGNISPNMRNKARVTLHNTGSRAAFVSGVLENEEGYTLPTKVAWINPTSFVIPSNSSRELYVIYEAGPAKESAASVNRIALLKLYCGDEIARRRFCSVLKILDRYCSCCCVVLQNSSCTANSCLETSPKLHI